MHYNKQEKPILLREYGRNVQSLAQSLKREQDYEKRTILAYELVRIMALVSPAAKDSPDYRAKLWNHLYQICDYELEVNAPFPLQKPEEVKETTGRMEYYTCNSKMKQYGRNLEKMIEVAVKMPDGATKDAYVLQIANIMKQSLMAANHNINDQTGDQIVREHLALLSGSAIQYQEDILLKPKKQAPVQYFKQTPNPKYIKPRTQQSNQTTQQNNQKNFKYRRPGTQPTNPFNKPVK